MMAILNFSLSPESTGRVYELLVCLAKFGESVSVEAKSEKASEIPVETDQEDFADNLAAHNNRSQFIKDCIRLIRTRFKDILHQL